MKRKLFTFASLAIVAAAASAFTLLRAPATAAKQVDTVWYFTGDNINEADEAAHWSTTNPNLGCGSGADLPCQMTVSNAPNEEALQTFLTGKDVEDIRDEYASSRRAE